MKISQVTVERVNVQLTEPYEIAFAVHDSVELVYVRVTTDTGLTGFGSGSPCEYVTGESLGKSMSALDAYRDVVMGQSPFCATQLHRLMVAAAPEAPAAQAAMDMALYDLMGKYLEMPVVDLLGRAQVRMATSVTIGICSVAEAIEKAKAFVQKGFKILKVKLGNNLEEDLERLIKLREQLPSEIGIRVDPNQGYDGENLCKFLTAAQELRLEFVEQPCAPRLDDTLPPLVDRSLLSSLPLAADESLQNAGSATTFLKTHDLYDIFNIKLMKCGGITGARQIIAIAEAAGKQLMWGCNDESIGSISAALHTAFSSNATRYLDLDGHLDLASDQYRGGLILDEGMMSLQDTPGLGVVLDEASVY